MGAHGKEFLSFRMYREDYDELEQETKDLMTLKYQGIEGFDYSKDSIWSELNKQSKKIWKQKRDREIDLRLGND